MVNLSIKDKVFDLLTRYPHLRDSDEKLCSNIWYSKIEKGLSATEFLAIYSEGKLPNSESITRCRRKVQEDHPELRGTLYEEKQAKQEQIKEELGYPVLKMGENNQLELF
jgi:hypothetical protein